MDGRAAGAVLGPAQWRAAIDTSRRARSAPCSTSQYAVLVRRLITAMCNAVMPRYRAIDVRTALEQELHRFDPTVVRGEAEPLVERILNPIARRRRGGQPDVGQVRTQAQLGPLRHG